MMALGTPPPSKFLGVPQILANLTFLFVLRVLHTDVLSLVVMLFVFWGCIDSNVSTAGGPFVFFSSTKRYRILPCVTPRSNASQGENLVLYDTGISLYQYRVISYRTLYTLSIPYHIILYLSIHIVPYRTRATQHNNVPHGSVLPYTTYHIVPYHVTQHRTTPTRPVPSRPVLSNKIPGTVFILSLIHI